MGLTKISELPNGETLELTGDEVAVIVKDGTTYKIPLSALLKLDVVTRMGNLSQEDITTSAQGGFRVIPKLNGVADYFGMIAAEDVDFPVDSNTYLLLSRIFGDGEGYVLTTAKVIPNKTLNGYPGKELEFELPNESGPLALLYDVNFQKAVETNNAYGVQGIQYGLEADEYKIVFINYGNITGRYGKNLFLKDAEYGYEGIQFSICNDVADPGSPRQVLNIKDGLQEGDVLENKVVNIITPNLPEGDYEMLVKTSKFYKALLTQTGTDAPTAIVHDNDFDDAVLQRDGVGNYSLFSASGAFKEDKTYVTIGNAQISGSFVKASWESQNKIRIETYTIALVSGELTIVPIEDEPLFKTSFIVEVVK